MHLSVFDDLVMAVVSSSARMDTTEQCNTVISHFNGKFIKTASGALGRNEFIISFLCDEDCVGGHENDH